MQESFLDKTFKVMFVESQSLARNAKIIKDPKPFPNLWGQDCFMFDNLQEEDMDLVLARRLSHDPIDKKRMIQYFFKQLEAICIKKIYKQSERIEIDDVYNIYEKFVDIIISFEKNRNKVKGFYLSKYTMQAIREIFKLSYMRPKERKDQYEENFFNSYRIFVDRDIENSEFFGVFFGFPMFCCNHIANGTIIAVGEHNYNTIFYHEDGRNYIASVYVDNENNKIINLTDKKLERMFNYHGYDTSTSF